MPSIIQTLFVFFSDDPALRLVQILLLVIGLLVVFLVFFALRGVLLRSRSFPYQLLCIALVAFFPIVGFLLYLLIRPSRTLRERARDDMLADLHAHLIADRKKAEKPQEKAEKAEKTEKAAKEDKHGKR